MKATEIAVAYSNHISASSSGSRDYVDGYNDNNNTTTTIPTTNITTTNNAFTEINLNCGCPSNKASKREFGLSLMKNPDLVRRCCYNIKRYVCMCVVFVRVL